MPKETRKILIVEDEFPMRYLIEHQLKQSGYEVHLAKDGADGLKAIQQNRPDLVLLDVMMPGMDGFEVCTRIKHNPETTDIPVIFVTASEVPEYRARAFDVGAAEYMTKPFRADELLAHITAVLHRVETIDGEDPTATGALDRKQAGHITSFFSPKGGVGVTTLAVQFAEAMTLYAGRPVVLIDFHLPLGGIAPMLRLFPRHDIIELLSIDKTYITLDIIDQFTLRYRDNLFVIPAPGRLIDPNTHPDMEAWRYVCNLLISQGYEVVVDAGSSLSISVIEVLTASEPVFVVTNGQTLVNQQVDVFLQSADHLGLDPRLMMPVINELNGSVREVALSRIPVARIPFAGQPSDTKLWLKEQGLRKMIALLH